MLFLWRIREQLHLIETLRFDALTVIVKHSQYKFDRFIIEILKYNIWYCYFHCKIYSDLFSAGKRFEPTSNLTLKISIISSNIGHFYLLSAKLFGNMFVCSFVRIIVLSSCCWLTCRVLPESTRITYDWTRNQCQYENWDWVSYWP